jgi:hypothetical protein
MSQKGLLQVIKNKQRQGLLDYKWEVRSNLLKNEKESEKEQLYNISISPFLYLEKYRLHIDHDPSLKAVCQLCTEIDLVSDVDHNDERLIFLAHLFNKLTNSGRKLHECYDCGTTARGVFFQLIKAYRGGFNITPEEIDRIKSEYYMTRYQGSQGVINLRGLVHKISQNCLFMCAMQLGEDFGHIYIIEKIYINKKPRYRLYQSCLGAFLLIDYIEVMDYASRLTKGVDIDAHLNALDRLFTKRSWSAKDIVLFIDWFKFYPINGALPSEKKLFTFTHVIF